MSFEPRTYEEILSDMIAYMQANTPISDFTVGSVIRTILEAAALEDDEQYFQMTQLIAMFSFRNASGSDLDRRMADFDLFRRPARPAIVPVVFFNKNLVTNQIGLDMSAGATVLSLFDTSDFPTSGYPYTVRLAEGTSRVEDLSVTNNDTAAGQLTVSSGISNAAPVGDRVTLLNPASSYTINVGTVVRSAPTVSQSPRTFSTTEPAYILPGNYYSNEVLARSQSDGSGSNVGAQRVSQFNGSPPFPGAGVTNPRKATSGRNRETDEEFRIRGAARIQSLSRGTPLALISESIGVEDPITGQTVISADLYEDFVEDEVIVFVDDGTGLTPDTASYTSDSLSSGVTASTSTVLPLTDASDWPSSGLVYVNDGSDSELLTYTNKTSSELVLDGVVANNHSSGTVVYAVDRITESAEDGQRRFRIRNFPIVRGTLKLYWQSPSSGNWSSLEEGTDYLLNKGTGELQIVDTSGLPSGTQLVANYDYYTNLIAETQKVLEGDIDSPTNYPGVKAAGIFLSVEAPTLKRVNVKASISASSGYRESTLAPLVRQEIESYISSRKIGEDVVLSKMVDAAYNVRGLADIKIITPSSNQTVLENELAVPFDSAGLTLVTVS